MKKSLPICALLILVAGEAVGCPYCVYNRVMPTWTVFAALRVFAVCVVAGAVLKEWRILGVFIAYEVLYYHLWRFAVWESYSDLAAILAIPFLLVLSLGVPAALVLKFVGRFEWFRRTPERDVSWTRALLIIPAMLLLQVAEGLVTAGL